MTRRTAVSCFVGAACASTGRAESNRDLRYRDYLDKVHGGWLGKIAGVALGVPKEFAEPWPPSEGDYFAEVPTHYSDLFSGDDVYFPLLVQLVLQKYGSHPTAEQYMKEWDARMYSGRVWGANSKAYEHWKAGIAPPKTGQPGYNTSADLDAQIDFDPTGWVAPGMANTAGRLADEGAHLMSWGEGSDGAVFVAAALSAAFFSSDIEQVIRAGQSVLPERSRYSAMIDDVVSWSKTNPDWRITRQMLAKKYSQAPMGRDITAVSNGGAVLLGLLYGKKDIGKTLSISMRARWDSDCNPSTAGGILGTMLGASQLDPRWSKIFNDTWENYCVRGLPRWMRISGVARDTVEIGARIIQEEGGEVSGTGADRVFRIRTQAPSRLKRTELDAKAVEASNRAEMESHYASRLAGATKEWDPAWKLSMAAFENPPAVLPEYMGRRRVFRAQPGFDSAVTLERALTLPAGKHHYLRVGVAHHPNILNEQTGAPEIGGWRLEVHANGKKIGGYNVRTQGGMVVWEDPQFDLTPFAGSTVQIRLLGFHDMRYTEFYMASQNTYWSAVDLLTLDQPEPWRNI